MSNPKPEVWQRGPVAGIPALLQPVAHALLQAREEVDALMKNFPSRYLWQKPAGVASVGFHLQHLTGVLDRLFTYARNESLSTAQREWLASEGKSFESENPVQELISRFNSQVDQALQQLANTDEQTLTDFRGIGRAQLPSTVLGLLFHSAEHTQRHVGQLFVTVRVLLTYPNPDH
ncbi:DinB family protein [Larkinella humicola]|uniref:DinB family protein n=1 Tax=Larkinella humicola TaxID=2607654 RepID=A0A5N1J5P8_9BACT|nr:DinB family protein [Larkinella humicola]KAA9346231.1 DinB family protein [Larkinella humicola]